jgi:hypothetical protein
MNANQNQSIKLWTKESPTPSVKQYIDGTSAEFPYFSFESLFPYQGLASSKFRFIRDVKEQFPYFRFSFKHAGGWKLRRDRFQNNVTADILAAADLLGGKPKSESSAYMSGLEQDDIFIPLLDGGVTVYVRIVEHGVTCNLSGYQGTFIWGTQAYRALTTFLGFDWSPRRLSGEMQMPQARQVWDTVDGLLSTDHAKECFSLACGNRKRP